MTKTPEAIRQHNRKAWDLQVGRGNQWTVPVSPEVIAEARAGRWSIVLTPQQPVPREWFPDPLTGIRLLALASGGGQQAPVLAAAGARVTLLDNSPAQLEQDRSVAQRDGLDLETVLGDMADLNAFPNDHFDLIVHPCSNSFVPDVRPVWREAFRVLKPGGTLIAGIVNPAVYLFDEGDRSLVVRHKLPSDDLTQLQARGEAVETMEDPISFSHSLDDQIGGQLEAGFLLIGFFEDKVAYEAEPLSSFMPCSFATRALKPAVPLPGPRAESTAHKRASIGLRSPHPKVQER